MTPSERFSAVPHAAWSDDRLTKAATAVLGTLNSWWHTTGSARPSVQTLARDLGMNRRTVQRALRTLQDTGWVIQKITHNSRGWVVGAEYVRGPAFFTQFPVAAAGPPRGLQTALRDQHPGGWKDSGHSDRFEDEVGAPKQHAPPLHWLPRTRRRET